MHALVISGGGSKGAFAGGVAQYLIQEEKKEYDFFIGTSTGSLMISHLALGRIDQLKQLYTSVNQSTIFSNCPFIVKGKGTAKTVSINHFKVLWNIIRKKKSFGESGNLRKLIHKTITEDFHQELLSLGKDLIVTVSNLTRGHVEYKSIHEFSREEFCDWIWASCNYVPFMSLFEKDYMQYADGGFGALVPIKEAIQRGASVVDAVILDTEHRVIDNLPAKNPFSAITQVIEFSLEQVANHNVSIGKLASKYHDVELNLYYTPTILTTNSLVFDKKLMHNWWNDGFAYAKHKHNSIKMSELKLEDK